MSVLEWFFIGVIILFFMGIMFFSLSDLKKDLIYYKKKQKNVKHMNQYQKQKKISNNTSKNISKPHKHKNGD
ncbi:hypothetical protein QE109_09905 [Fusibacter bizertensis]|jgi:hypothetical protein|uniref:Uncharacterized protein n=1 Tax=Fusibacter bizertensis TaxID=1488331 RepID=A0ABT6NDL6_9FIRM|nr:hypothetical protein [Fusibacter bizertensis]MDH8678460.1 hypothetical protein [Fusibacter bizertensis]